ncbi:MAG: glutathione S-transferase family protein [Rhodobacteraceae bacterium]|jgi:glutathione S-transferase|nr:glutathione S-transferase family protein [Paracoccaceae bacterium]
MYTLHYAPDNASLVIRLVMEQARIPYTTTLINRAVREQDSPTYLALNPVGLIPTLVTPHGPVSETGAILLWLADTHALAPGAHDPARLPFLKWLFFIANTAHPDMRQLFYPHRFVDSEGRASHFALTIARINANFALLDQAAQDNPRLFAPDGLLLPYVAALQRWAHLYPATGPRWFRLSDTPILARLAKVLEATPAAQRSALAEGLGPTPFTAPALPFPPEGSAT